MVTGRLRAFLWLLAGAGVMWILLSLLLLPPLWRGVGEETLMGGRVIPTLGGATMAGVAFLLVMQFLVMAGLAGLFVYLLLDSFRARSPRAGDRI